MALSQRSTGFLLGNQGQTSPNVGQAGAGETVDSLGAGRRPLGLVLGWITLITQRPIAIGGVEPLLPQLSIGPDTAGPSGQ